MSRTWLDVLFQGDRGQRGVMGELGPKGETVSSHSNSTDALRRREI